MHVMVTHANMENFLLMIQSGSSDFKFPKVPWQSQSATHTKQNKKACQRINEVKRQEVGEVRQVTDMLLTELPCEMQADTALHEGEQLGKGSYGAVYRGYLGPDQPVAVKKPATKAASGSDLPPNRVIIGRKAQHKEGDILERVAHRRIIRSHGLRGDDLVLELAADNLARALRDPK